MRRQFLAKLKAEPGTGAVFGTKRCLWNWTFYWTLKLLYVGTPDDLDAAALTPTVPQSRTVARILFSMRLPIFTRFPWRPFSRQSSSERSSWKRSQPARTCWRRRVVGAPDQRLEALLAGHGAELTRALEAGLYTGHKGPNTPFVLEQNFLLFG